MGFEHHLGPATNLIGSGETYYSFAKNVDGTELWTTQYATTDQVNDARDIITGFQGSPWFLWLAFSAPHAPLHAPPDHLHSYSLGGLDPDDPANGPIFMKAMTEAMDTEIGRLLDSIHPAVLANTFIIFVGDNGTTAKATSAPWDTTKGKGTMYEGGINVPMIVVGPGIPAGTESQALMHVVDLFATIAELAEADASTGIDSTSQAAHLFDPTLPGDSHVYGERFQPNGFGPFNHFDQVARDAQFKYLRRYTITGQLHYERLYDLMADPFETIDLMNIGGLPPAAQDALDTLRAVCDQH